MAELLAEESLKRFGFVVVGYKPGTLERNRGIPTKSLWREYTMPQPFVPVRLATPQEWRAQQSLFLELFGYQATPESPTDPVVMVTD